MQYNSMALSEPMAVRSTRASKKPTVSKVRVKVNVFHTPKFSLSLTLG
jgi:hypothetical protein